MSATTLVVIPTPTLRDGMGELLAIGTALLIGQAIGMGVTVWRDHDGGFADAEADPEVPLGVLETQQAAFIDPWADTDASWRASEARHALELLHQHTEGDVVFTPDGFSWL